MAKKKGLGSTGSLRNNKVIMAVILALVVLVFFGALTLLKGAYQTSTYYVLNTTVPARTQIQPSMLSPVVTSQDGAPTAALTLSDVQGGNVYSRYPLASGDILTNSNVSVNGQDDIAAGVPDTYVITTFPVSADNAVGGRIHRGDYFDMMIASGNGSFYPFVNILALDTTVSLSGASNDNAANTSEAHAGQTSQYVVGMTPQDAARLQQIVQKWGSGMKLVLAPRQNQYAAPQLASYQGMFSFSTSGMQNDVTTQVTNQGKDSDYTFAPVKRDEFGRPIKTENKNCSQGNGQVTDPKICAKQSSSASSTTTGSNSQ